MLDNKTSYDSTVERNKQIIQFPENIALKAFSLGHVTVYLKNHVTVYLNNHMKESCEINDDSKFWFYIFEQYCRQIQRMPPPLNELPRSLSDKLSSISEQESEEKSIQGETSSLAQLDRNNQGSDKIINANDVIHAIKVGEDKLIEKRLPQNRSLWPGEYFDIERSGGRIEVLSDVLTLIEAFKKYFKVENEHWDKTEGEYGCKITKKVTGTCTNDIHTYPRITIYEKNNGLFTIEFTRIRGKSGSCSIFTTGLRNVAKMVLKYKKNADESIEKVFGYEVLSPDKQVEKALNALGEFSSLFVEKTLRELSTSSNFQIGYTEIARALSQLQCLAKESQNHLMMIKKEVHLRLLSLMESLGINKSWNRRIIEIIKDFLNNNIFDNHWDNYSSFCNDFLMKCFDILKEYKTADEVKNNYDEIYQYINVVKDTLDCIYALHKKKISEASTQLILTKLTDYRSMLDSIENIPEFKKYLEGHVKIHDIRQEYQNKIEEMLNNLNAQKNIHTNPVSIRQQGIFSSSSPQDENQDEKKPENEPLHDGHDSIASPNLR